MIIGRLICEKCGVDCTALYGFALMTRGTIRDQRTQKELDEVKKVFGKNEFVWCWGCTVEAFGVKPVAERKVEEKRNEIPIEKQDPKKPKLESVKSGV